MDLVTCHANGLALLSSRGMGLWVHGAGGMGLGAWGWGHGTLDHPPPPTHNTHNTQHTPPCLHHLFLSMKKKLKCLSFLGLSRHSHPVIKTLGNSMEIQAVGGKYNETASMASSPSTLGMGVNPCKWTWPHAPWGWGHGAGGTRLNPGQLPPAPLDSGARGMGTLR